MEGHLTASICVGALAVSAKRLLVVYSANLTVCGVGTWLETLDAALEGTEWHLTVGLAWGNHFHVPARIVASRPGLRTVWLDGRTGTETGRRMAVRRAIRRVNPDVVLVTLLDDAVRAAVAEKHNRPELRVGVALHGNAPNHLAHVLEQAESLDLVTCVNRACYQLLDDWPVTSLADVLHCIPNAVRRPTRERKPPGSPFRVGYVGRLHDDKRVCDLQPFWENLCDDCGDAELWIAGQGDHETLVRDLADHPSGRVRYLGAVSREILYEQVYPELDVLLCFSPSEGWPMSIAEAMAHGVVPVSSCFTGITVEGVIRNGETGLIFPVGRPEQAARLVAHLARSPDELMQLSRNAALEMERQYSLEKFRENWLVALETCLAREPSVAAPVPRELFGSIRERCVEQIRRLLRKRFPHATARSEWPTLRCNDANLREAITNALATQHGEQMPSERSVDALTTKAGR